jgi:hypothetical protein
MKKSRKLQFSKLKKTGALKKMAILGQIKKNHRLSVRFSRDQKKFS